MKSFTDSWVCFTLDEIESLLSANWYIWYASPFYGTVTMIK